MNARTSLKPFVSLRYTYWGGGIALLLFLIWTGDQALQRLEKSQQLNDWMEVLPEIIEPQEGYELAQQARQLAVDLGKDEEIGKAFYFMALYGTERDRFSGYFSERSRLHIEESIQIFQETQSSFWLAKALLLLQNLRALNTNRTDLSTKALNKQVAKLKFEERAWVEAHIMLNEGLRLGRLPEKYQDTLLKSNALLAESANQFAGLGDMRQEANCYRSLGTQHQDLVYNAYNLAYEEEDQNTIDSIVWLGKSYARDGIAYLNQAFQLFEAQGDTYGASHVIHRLGRIYSDLFLLTQDGLYLDTALTHFRRNLSGPYIYAQESTNEGIGTIFSHKYYADEREIDRDSTLHYLHLSADLAIEHVNLHQLNQTLEQLTWDIEENFKPVDNTFHPSSDYTPDEIRKRAIKSINEGATKINGQVYAELNEFDLSAARLAAQKDQQNILMIGGVLLALIVFAFVILYQRSQLDKLQQELDFSLKLAQTKMNPHFIGNTLNSIDSLINNDELEGGKEMASEYLVRFSRLADTILRNSDRAYINLQQELETLENYIELERLRLNEKFDYELEVASELPRYSIQIPPMLIQPVVENAIWHGLQHKIHGYKEHGQLKVKFSGDPDFEHFILCTVTDNGIGRVKARELQGKVPDGEDRTHSTEILGKRLGYPSTSHKGEVRIEDLYDPYGKALGTKVELKIPVYYT